MTLLAGENNETTRLLDQYEEVHGERARELAEVCLDNMTVETFNNQLLRALEAGMMVSPVWDDSGDDLFVEMELLDREDWDAKNT